MTNGRVGRYRLEEVLGEGASGVVYRASDESGSEVAVKLLRSGLKSSLLSYHPPRSGPGTWFRFSSSTIPAASSTS